MTTGQPTTTMENLNLAEVLGSHLSQEGIYSVEVILKEGKGVISCLIIEPDEVTVAALITETNIFIYTQPKHCDQCATCNHADKN